MEPAIPLSIARRCPSTDAMAPATGESSAPLARRDGGPVCTSVIDELSRRSVVLLPPPRRSVYIEEARVIATSPTRHARFAWTLEPSSIGLGVGSVSVEPFGKTAPRTLALPGQLPPLQVGQWSKQPEGRLILRPVHCVENSLFFDEQPRDESEPPDPSAFARITYVVSTIGPRPLGGC